ncbi:hypothetical protein FJZ36_08280 [Candidatus Poribacteria bacterium]|nr:hypothetical protein [Candidatus Poribacteria bacterium]
MNRLILSVGVLALACSLSIPGSAKVITLFEDDAAFIDALPNQDTATEIAIEKKIVFKGKVAVKLDAKGNAATNGQKYNANIAGWAYSIVEKPSKDTDARYILFSWRKDGGAGIMIQFPDNGAWGAVNAAFVDPPAPGTRRYIAGENLTGWTGIQVSKDVPKNWTPVIRDLWGDFTNFTMTGVALTQFNEIGYYDAIYLAWTKAELEAIVQGVLPVEPRTKLATAWAELKTQ